MFSNDVLDMFSRIPAWVVPAIYVPVIVGSAAIGSTRGVEPGVLLAQIGAGWFAWTLMEYWLHRTLFHWVPNASWGEQFHFYLHGVHHKWFRDRFRLVMPPAASAAVAVVVFSGLWIAAQASANLWNPAWIYGFFSGITLGYLVYDMTHYAIHHTKPRTAVGKALRAHHNKHHHNAKYKDKKFGVSITLWDHVFGTYE